MMKWIILTVVIISGGILGYMYYELDQISSSTATLPPPPDPRAVRIVEGYADGVHRYDGQIKLPHSCYTVTEAIFPDKNDPSGIVIELTSQNNILEQKVCAQIPTAYPFEIVYDAPENMHVKLILDGDDLPITLIKKNWQSPLGSTLINNPSSTSSPE